MTEQEIREGNRLIAEFMGYVKSSSDNDFTFYEHPNKRGIVIQSEYDYQKFITHELMELRGFIFHRSWNWLMTVVEKIEAKGFDVFINGLYCRITDSGLTDLEIESREVESKIEATWLAVIEFIKWYNENKQ